MLDMLKEVASLGELGWFTFHHQWPRYTCSWWHYLASSKVRARLGVNRERTVPLFVAKTWSGVIWTPAAARSNAATKGWLPSLVEASHCHQATFKTKMGLKYLFISWNLFSYASLKWILGKWIFRNVLQLRFLLHYVGIEMMLSAWSCSKWI